MTTEYSDLIARISEPETMTKIRAKQAAKPKHSPLPEARAAVDAARAERSAAPSPRIGHRSADFDGA